MNESTLKTDDFEIIKKHLEKYFLKCPNCGGKSCNVSGIAMSFFIDLDTKNCNSGLGVPKVQVICEACGYVNEFSWLFIKNGLAER